MRYRTFGQLDWKVSALGFGAMRLPVIGGDAGNIDEPEAMRMMRYAIDHGVNYIDTAHTYHDGNSQAFVGKVLRDGYREKVKLATKMWIPAVNSQQDMDSLLDGQLAKLQIDHVDFYLLHALDKQRWGKVRDLNVLDWAERAIADGRIRHLGFSFHDDIKLFKEIVDSYDNWTSCQIQYNYMDAEETKSTISRFYTPGGRALEYVASKGLAVVIMEPLMGGSLTIEAPPAVQEIWNEAQVRRTQAEWGFQWIWNRPEVSVVLSGMSTMEQVTENVESASRSGPGTLTDRELELVSRVGREYRAYGFVGCTYCRDCMPCQEGVNIEGILRMYNEYFSERGHPYVQKQIVSRYSEAISAEEKAELCNKCGECEEKCPQHLPIISLLARASRTFERDS